jgi:polysaccharide pyruvyl transferase WcaK-like protein
MPTFQSTLNQLYWIKQRASYSLFPNSILEEIDPLKETPSSPDAPRIGHIAMYTTGNAGDTLLPLTIRESLTRESPINWKGIHAHRVVNRNVLKTLQEQDGLLIGGGGLFLNDTNPNNLSGWQWSCSLKKLEQINRPLAVFAVGYNRFRGQKDFKPIFRDHLQLLAEKSVFIGLRNSGSIQAIKSYLPTQLHAKVHYQPCPTTLLHTLYSFPPPLDSTQPPTIAINAAFDRLQLRLGDQYASILKQIALACKQLSQDYQIVYYAHAKSDHQMIPYLEQAQVPHRRVDLFHVPAKTIIEAYQKPALVIGMRGHAQMIPFGCTTPILSLISHDKMRWFLQDIDRPQWGIEMNQPDLTEKLIVNATSMLNNRPSIQQDIRNLQAALSETTQTNARNFLNAL